MATSYGGVFASHAPNRSASWRDSRRLLGNDGELERLLALAIAVVLAIATAATTEYGALCPHCHLSLAA